MVNVILDQSAFGLLHCLFHGLQLLCDVHAGLFVFNHLDDAGQMPVGTFQPLDDGGVACMSRVFCHMTEVTPKGGSSKWAKTHESRWNDEGNHGIPERNANRRFGDWYAPVCELPFGHP